MMNEARIMRMAERALKRTEAYLEKRSFSSAPEENFRVDYVLVKGSKSTPDAAIAYAHYEDVVISFNPLESGGAVRSSWEWAFSFDSELFSHLEQGYKLIGMLPEAHCAAWGEITEYHASDGIIYPKGMQQYLNYCKRNGVTAKLLHKEFQYDGMDVMVLYDKTAVHEKPSQEEER